MKKDELEQFEKVFLQHAAHPQTNREFVLKILPRAEAVPLAGGWAILAKPLHSPALVSGARDEDTAWGWAAHRLGREVDTT